MLKGMLLIGALLSASACAEEMDMVASPAEYYAQSLLYQHIGNERELSEEELRLVNQIASKYESLQLQAEQEISTKQKEILPGWMESQAENSEYQLMQALFDIRLRLYEFFLESDFEAIVNENRLRCDKGDCNKDE